METIAPPEISSQLKLNVRTEVSFNFEGAVLSDSESEQQLVTTSFISPGNPYGEEGHRTQLFNVELRTSGGALNLLIRYNRYIHEENTLQKISDGFGRNLERIIDYYAVGSIKNEVNKPENRDGI